MKKGQKHSKETRKIISEKLKEKAKDPKYYKRIIKTAFKKGSIPWNKDIKGIHLSPKSEFKEDQIVGPNHPSWKDGVQVNKDDCVHLWVGKNKRVRRPVFVWEQHYGKIPPGHIVWHIDGDKHNDDITNLELITRAECMQRNFKERWK